MGERRRAGQLAFTGDSGYFFGVSVDALFGRSVTDYSDLHDAVKKRIGDAPYEEKLVLMDSLCWTMQTALFSGDPRSWLSLSELRQPEKHAYSEYHGADGYTLIGLNGSLPYYMFLPKTPVFDDFGITTEDFCAFFGALSDPAVFDAFVLITKTGLKKFTAKRLMTELDISGEKAAEVLETLMKYQYLCSEEIEIDDVVHTVYNCPMTTPAVFAPMLLIAYRLIKGNYWFHGFCGSDMPCLK